MTRNPPDDVLDTNQAATYLGTTPGYLRNLRSEGRGPKAFRLAIDRHRVYYRKSDLNAFIRGMA